MNRTETIYNSLNMRGLQEITPPICGNYVNKHHLSFGKLAEPTLLHQGLCLFVAGFSRVVWESKR